MKKEQKCSLSSQGRCRLGEFHLSTLGLASSHKRCAPQKGSTHFSVLFRPNFGFSLDIEFCYWLIDWFEYFQLFQETMIIFRVLFLGLCLAVTELVSGADKAVNPAEIYQNPLSNGTFLSFWDSFSMLFNIKFLCYGKSRRVIFIKFLEISLRNFDHIIFDSSTT